MKVAMTAALAMLVLAGPVRGSVQLQDGAETLGDLEPILIGVEDRSLPDFSLEDAVRRYVEVFETMSDAATRVSVLNRIQNLQARFGDDLGLSEAQSQSLHRQALKDFETLLARDETPYDGRARLLYEAARASDIAGKKAASIDYLETLMAEHPESELVAESAFRVGEHWFSRNAHAQAVSAFSQAVGEAGDSGFRERATYMLGWSQLLDQRHDAASDTFIGFLDNHYDDSAGFAHLTGKAREQVEDSMRVLSLISAHAGGGDKLGEILARHGGRPYEARLYRHLSIFYREHSRYRDSVEAAEAFRRQYPDHELAPVLADEAIRSWEVGNFPERAREARARFIEDYGDLEAAADLDRKRRKRLMDSLKELGVWHYRLAQDSDEGGEDFRSASRYLSQWADLHDHFPSGNRFETPGLMLLLAGDASQRAGDAETAMALYERAAYRSPPFPAAREAGYALLQLRHDHWGQGSGSGAQLDRLVRDATRFIQIFSGSPRVPSVRHELVNILYDNERHEHARRVAEALVASSAVDRHKRAGWIVIGNVALENAAYATAEKAWDQVLSLTPEDDERRPEFRRRIAVSIYHRGEQAREAGEADAALDHFWRASRVAPEAEAGISAAFDRAGLLLEVERWFEAISALRNFRDRYPEHELTPRISERLVYAYLQSEEPGSAADEMMAYEPRDLSGAELWEYRLDAARHYRSAERLSEAAAIHESFLREGTRVLGDHEFHQQRRHDLIAIYIEQGRTEKVERLHRAVLEAEERHEGTGASRLLASRSALWLGRGAAREFAAVKLGAPLEDSLARKRDAMKVAIDYYQQAESFGFPETATESTYRLAEMYRRLAQDVIDSERPEGLTDLQADQYEMLLEEEAYPFEEKAIELHQRNQKRIAEGHWSRWISRSLGRLAEIFPARYDRETRWMEARNGQR